MPEKRSNVGEMTLVLRHLGSFETYQAVQTSTGIYAATAVTCRYAIPQDLANASLHSTLVEHWELALTRCILQHPLLQVALVDEDSNKPAWAAIEKIDLTKHVEWRIVGDTEGYTTALDTAVKEAVSTKFAALETRPGWRITVLRQENGSFLDAIFFWHHAYADGKGAKVFHETLLECLNTTDRQVPQDALENHVIKTTASKQNIAPTQEVAGNYPITLGFAAQTLWEKLKPPMLSKSNPFHVNWAPIRLSPCETRIESLSIDHITLQAVLSSCRTHNTTLTGLLHALALLSLASQLPEKDAPALGSTSAVDLRRHLSPRPPKYPTFDPSKTVANYVSMMDHKFDQRLVSKIRNLAPRERSADLQLGPELEDVIWPVAATVRGEIQERLASGLKNDPVGLTKLIRDWRPFFKDQIRKPRASCWLVTNLGVVDGAPGTGEGKSDSPAWTIARARFSLCAAAIGGVFSISPMAVKGGDLCIDISYQTGVFDDSIGERLAADIDHWLRQIGTRA